MNKKMQVAIITGIVVIGASAAYSFVFRPILNERRLNTCFQEANANLDKIKQESADSNMGVADKIIDKVNNPIKYAALAELSKRAEEAKKDCYIKFPQK